MTGNEADLTTAKPLTAKRPSRAPTWLGILLTATYLVIVILNVSIPEMRTLTYPDMGAFLVGVFAPVAFLWLVLGFFQQGEELRNSVDALRLQSEELRASVEQQKALVGITREQFDHIKERGALEEEEEMRRAQPRFDVEQLGSVSFGAGVGRSHDFRITNTGTKCTDVRVSTNGYSDIWRSAVMDTGGTMKFEIRYKEGDFEQTEGSIAYVDALGAERTKPFILTAQGSSLTIELGSST